MSAQINDVDTDYWDDLPVSSNRLDLLKDIPLHVNAELGRTKMVVRDILRLGVGSVVELDRENGEPVDLLVNNKLIARGEVVEIDGNFGIKVTEIFR